MSKIDIIIQDYPVESWEQVCSLVLNKLKSHKLEEVTRVIFEKNKISIEKAKPFR